MPAAPLRLAGLCLLALLLSACAGTPQSDALLDNVPPALAKPVELTRTPFFPQEDYQCGPAALATVLRTTGIAVTPEELVPRVYLPARQGSLQIEIVAAARRYGRIPYVIAPRLQTLLDEVRDGHPVLVLQNLGTDWFPVWHYAVVIGFDLGAGEVVLRSGRLRRHVQSLPLFERTWARARHWGLILVRPGETTAGMAPLPYLKAVNGLAAVADNRLLLRAWRAGVQRWPNHAPLRMALGNTLYALGEKDAALAEFLAITRQQPAYAPAHNNAAQILFEQGRLAEAVSHAREAVRLGGPHAETYRQTLEAILAAGGSAD